MEDGLTLAAVRKIKGWKYKDNKFLKNGKIIQEDKEGKMKLDKITDEDENDDELNIVCIEI